MKNDQNEPTAQERAALRRLAKQENQRAEEANEQRIAELQEQRDERDLELRAIKDEYLPRIAALNAEQQHLTEQAVEVARRRDSLRIQMQGEQMELQTRHTQHDAELRRLQGRIIPIPQFFESDDDRSSREEFEKQLTA